MRREHEIKLYIEYAYSVKTGEKLFEVRKNDRGYQKGDWVRFTIVDKSGLKVSFPFFNEAVYEITYVLGSFYGLADGYVAFGIRKIEEENQS